MKRRFVRCVISLLLLLVITPVPKVLAWTDQAHMAMGLAAGFSCFHNCAAADVSHTVATINGLGQTDSQAHFFNVPADTVLTASDVYGQLQSIGQSQAECPLGYLPGAILHTTRLCRERTAGGAYDDEYYAVLLHYVADLAQPLHMSPYDDFNRGHHFACDNILSDKEAAYPVLAAISLAAELTPEDIPAFSGEEDLVEAVLTLARQSQALGVTLRAEQRDLTREEALLQLSRATALGRAILRYCGKSE